jgi:hypothetical protein
MWIDMTSSRSPLYRHVNWESVLAFGAGLALAALARDSVLSTFSVMAGAYVAWWFHRQHRSRQSAVAPEHLERLVWQLRAVYPLLPSAMDALEVSAARLPEGKLQRTAEECVTRYRAATLTSPGALAESLKPLYDLFIVNLTRRVLEAVLVGAVALALTMPNTRMFYTGSLAARLVLMAFTVFGTALCLRLEAEAGQFDPGSP